MELNNNETQLIISILRTLIYNPVEDLIEKLKKAKETLDPIKYNLMMYGDEDLFTDKTDILDNEKYKKITILGGRWCLNSQLYYHLTKTKKINEDEYNKIINI